MPPARRKGFTAPKREESPAQAASSRVYKAPASNKHPPIAGSEMSREALEQYLDTPPDAETHPSKRAQSHTIPKEDTQDRSNTQEDQAESRRRLTLPKVPSQPSTYTQPFAPLSRTAHSTPSYRPRIHEKVLKEAKTVTKPKQTRKTSSKKADKQKEEDRKGKWDGPEEGEYDASGFWVPHVQPQMAQEQVAEGNAVLSGTLDDSAMKEDPQTVPAGSRPSRGDIDRASGRSGTSKRSQRGKEKEKEKISEAAIKEGGDGSRNSISVQPASEWDVRPEGGNTQTSPQEHVDQGQPPALRAAGLRPALRELDPDNVNLNNLIHALQRSRPTQRSISPPPCGQASRYTPEPGLPPVIPRSGTDESDTDSEDAIPVSPVSRSSTRRSNSHRRVYSLDNSVASTPESQIGATNTYRSGPSVPSTFGPPSAWSGKGKRAHGYTYDPDEYLVSESEPGTQTQSRTQAHSQAASTFGARPLDHQYRQSTSRTGLRKVKTYSKSRSGASRGIYAPVQPRDPAADRDHFLTPEPEFVFAHNQAVKQLQQSTLKAEGQKEGHDRAKRQGSTSFWPCSHHDESALQDPEAHLGLGEDDNNIDGDLDPYPDRGENEVDHRQRHVTARGRGRNGAWPEERSLGLFAHGYPVVPFSSQSPAPPPTPTPPPASPWTRAAGDGSERVGYRPLTERPDFRVRDPLQPILPQQQAADMVLRRRTKRIPRGYRRSSPELPVLTMGSSSSIQARVQGYTEKVHTRHNHAIPPIRARGSMHKKPRRTARKPALPHIPEFILKPIDRIPFAAYKQQLKLKAAAAAGDGEPEGFPVDPNLIKAGQKACFEDRIQLHVRHRATKKARTTRETVWTETENHKSRRNRSQSPVLVDGVSDSVQPFTPSLTGFAAKAQSRRPTGTVKGQPRPSISYIPRFRHPKLRFTANSPPRPAANAALAVSGDTGASAGGSRSSGGGGPGSLVQVEGMIQPQAVGFHRRLERQEQEQERLDESGSNQTVPGRGYIRRVRGWQDPASVGDGDQRMGLGSGDEYWSQFNDPAPTSAPMEGALESQLDLAGPAQEPDPDLDLDFSSLPVEPISDAGRMLGLGNPSGFQMIDNILQRSSTLVVEQGGMQQREAKRKEREQRIKEKAKSAAPGGGGLERRNTLHFGAREKLGDEAQAQAGDGGQSQGQGQGQGAGQQPGKSHDRVFEQFIPQQAEEAPRPAVSSPIPSPPIKQAPRATPSSSPTVLNTLKDPESSVHRNSEATVARSSSRSSKTNKKPLGMRQGSQPRSQREATRAFKAPSQWSAPRDTHSHGHGHEVSQTQVNTQVSRYDCEKQDSDQELYGDEKDEDTPRDATTSRKTLWTSARELEVVQTDSIPQDEEEEEEEELEETIETGPTHQPHAQDREPTARQHQVQVQQTSRQDHLLSVPAPATKGHTGFSGKTLPLPLPLPHAAKKTSGARSAAVRSRTSHTIRIAGTRWIN